MSSSEIKLPIKTGPKLKSLTETDGGIQLLFMNTWSFPIKPGRDHLTTSKHQGHSVFGSPERVDLHPRDEGEGNSGCCGSALLLAALCVVDP